MNFQTFFLSISSNLHAGGISIFIHIRYPANWIKLLSLLIESLKIKYNVWRNCCPCAKSSFKCRKFRFLHKMM